MTSSNACVWQGLGLGPEALDILRSFGLSKELDAVSLPLPTDINRAVRPDGAVKVLSRDDAYNHRRCCMPSNTVNFFCAAFVPWGCQCTKGVPA